MCLVPGPEGLKDYYSQLDCVQVATSHGLASSQHDSLSHLYSGGLGLSASVSTVKTASSFITQPQRSYSITFTKLSWSSLLTRSPGSEGRIIHSNCLVEASKNIGSISKLWCHLIEKRKLPYSQWLFLLLTVLSVITLDIDVVPARHTDLTPYGIAGKHPDPGRLVHTQLQHIMVQGP